MLWKFGTDSSGFSMPWENLRVGRKSSQPTEGRDELGGVATREIGTAIASAEKGVTGEEEAYPIPSLKGRTIEADATWSMAGGREDGEAYPSPP